MKKFLSLCAAMVCACTMFAGVVKFTPADFAGQGTSSSGSAVSLTKDGVTVACSKGYGASESLRCYKGSSLSISSTSTIQKINLEFAASDKTGSLDAEIVVNALSWQVDALPSQARLSKISVTIDAEVVEVPVDTITVTQALARMADSEGNKGECYVKGKVLSIITNNIETYGYISYWMADIDNPTDSLQAYRMKGADNTAYPNAAAIEFVEDDEILVYAAGLAIYHNSSNNQDIPEINTGYYVRTISGADIVNLDWNVGNAYRETGKWVLEIEKVAGQAANVLRLVFSSDQETSIAGYHALENGSTITINGATTAITGSIKLTFKEINNNYLNVYTVQASMFAGDVAYRLNRDIEFYAQDSNGDEIVLIGDRPFIPNNGDTITCAQAKKHALSLATGETSIMTVTVRGFITDIFSNGITFWMDDQQGTAKTIQAYSCTMPTGVNVVNDTEVFVTGKLRNYNGTAEIDHGTVEVISGGVEIIPVEVTVSEAIAACQTLQNNAVSSETYAITGYISAIATEYSEQYGNISFWMSDNQNDNGQVFQAYRVKCDATTAAQLVVGARVTVTDKLKHFHQDATEGENPKPERTLYETNGGGAVKLISDTNDDDVPSDAVLANYYNQGKVCACFYVPANMACNNIVVTGQFNGWSSIVAECAPAVPVEGYDGWYVASFDPVEQSEFYGVSAKPIMLDVDGNFNWDYQIGAATSIRGGVQVVQGAYAGEIDLITYGTDAPNVFTVDAWKNNPCTAIYHNYTVTVVSAGCDDRVVPYLVGAMNGWTFQQMQYNAAKTADNNGVPTYDITFKAAEGTAYQIVSGKLNDAGEMEVQPGWYDDAYMQMLVDGTWGRIPGEDGDNFLTHEEANIFWDLRLENLRWARCSEATTEHVVLIATLPSAGAPELVEVIGSFDGWAGTGMELRNGMWIAEIEATEEQFFKFRSAGSWENELLYYNSEDNEWLPIGNYDLTFGQLWNDDTWYGEPCKMIEIDLSNPNYFRWSQAEAPTQSTQENVYVIYRNQDNGVIDAEQVTLTMPVAPIIPGFTFLKWVVVAGDLDEGINIQATYQYNGDATSAPSAFVNPANPAQKLIRNGNVYILHNGNTYTATGVKVE